MSITDSEFARINEDHNKLWLEVQSLKAERDKWMAHAHTSDVMGTQVSQERDEARAELEKVEHLWGFAQEERELLRAENARLYEQVDAQRAVISEAHELLTATGVPDPEEPGKVLSLPNRVCLGILNAKRAGMEEAARAVCGMCRGDRRAPAAIPGEGAPDLWYHGRSLCNASGIHRLMAKEGE